METFIFSFRVTRGSSKAFLLTFFKNDLFLIQSYVQKLLSSDWLRIFMEKSRTFEGMT